MSSGNQSSATGLGIGGGGLSVGPGGTTGPGGPGPSCSEAATLVYVLSVENDLYSFAPDQKKFTKIGPLGCQTSLTPNSMAIDRDAVAWVNYVSDDDSQGQVFKVSTADASCAPTSIQLGTGFTRLGMGFATDVAGGTAETLYIAGTSAMMMSNSPGLARIDFAKNTFTPIGSFTNPLKGQSAELTGTGDARLFGFFTTTPVQVAEINKATGAIKSTKPLPQVQTPLAWAFSFWGGSFYLYTSPDPSVMSNVAKYDPVSGTVDPEYMTNIGFIIVGAGVSTCAPITPPK
jgi:hypothetical protein